MDPHGNLLEPEPTLLPADEMADAELDGGKDPTAVAAGHPTSSAAWAALAERALGTGEPVSAYAFARTGYHRGLDQLRRAGWKGFGPIPWEHPPNQGFLRALGTLAKAAETIGEDDEATRCRDFLTESSPDAATALGLR